MENWWMILLTAAGGYLIGSVSVARIIFARLKPGEEPVRLRTPSTDRQAELVSHTIGATNVMLAFGPRWGLFATALDIAKAFVPTLALRLFFPADEYHLIGATAVLVGHLWPVWYKFRGGGGNSCIMGMLLAISPLGLIITHIGGMIIGKFFPVLAFLGGVFLMIPWFAWREGILSPEAAFAVVISLLYLAGQMPEAKQYRQLKRAGHVLETEHIMRLMKQSAATGRSGAQIEEEQADDAKEQPRSSDDSADR